MKHLFKWIGVIGIGFLSTFQSCIKEPPVQPKIENPQDVKGLRVVVLCEGNFLWNNASIDVYLPDSQKVYNNVYEAANGNDLGDVLQSALYHHGRLNLKVNNSGKIVQIHPKTFKLIQSKSGFSSPRYMISAGDKFFVSDIKSPFITLLDTQNLQKVGEFQVPDQIVSGESYWSEQMTQVDSLVFVAIESGKLMVINTQSNSRVLIEASKGATQLCSDAQKRVWLLCSNNGQTILYQFNGSTLKMEQQIPIFPHLSNVSATKMVLSQSGDQLHLLVNGKLATLPISSQVDSQKIRFVEISGLNNAYGLNVNPYNGDIYVGDAIDYVSNGKVFILNYSGILKHQFNTGVIPTDFVFIKD